MDIDSKIMIVICTFIVMFIGMFWMMALSNASYTIQMDDDMRAAIESLNGTSPYIIVNQYHGSNNDTAQILNLSNQLVACGFYNDMLRNKTTTQR